MTQARHRALDAHLASLRAPAGRRRPGSYAWPELRRSVEERYAGGAAPLHTHEIDDGPCTRCSAHAPSRRTLRRWHAERRWLTRPP